MSTKPVYRTRFAPSPTGLMHLGNARTALFNALYAQHLGGSCLLRIEDTDRQRSQSSYTNQIIADLAWLGIQWEGEAADKPFFQSERQAIYDAYYLTLLKNDQAYPCFCSEADLAVSRKAQLMQGKPPRYQGRCRHLSESEKQAKLTAKLPHALRFRVPQGQVIRYVDLIKGEQHFLSDEIGDFIIRRSDGSAAFFFCNAVDDALMGVTHALRGEDHVSNTPRQHLILSALELPIPQYGHFPIILGTDGSPLSKRNGSRSIQALQALGYDSMAVVNYMARLGHYYGDNALLSWSELSSGFNLASVSQSPAHFDESQLAFFQKTAMQSNDFEKFKDLCETYMGSQGHRYTQFTTDVSEWEQFLRLMQANVTFPAEVIAFAHDFFAKKPSWSEEALACLQAAGPTFFDAILAYLEASAALDYREFVQAVQTATGYKGKALYKPLRLMMSRRLEGPELDKLFLLLGKAALIERAKQVRDDMNEYVHD